MNIDVEKIKIEMARKKFTRNALLSAAKISPGTWHRLNRTRTASIATIGKIADGLSIDAAEIIIREEATE